ncbi:MAG: hypothetical protein II304_06095 [Bacteroidales bacterium]|nr:hypothetical protein [Bacteroidales bacterium]
MSYKYEYVENNWDVFLTDMANGERVRYGKAVFFFRERDFDKIELIVSRLKHINALTNVIGCEYGRTFFNITHKMIEKRSYDNDSYKVRLIAKFISFNKTEKDFYYNTGATLVLHKAIITEIGEDKITYQSLHTALTSVKDKDLYKKLHILKDHYGVELEIGDIVASGCGAAARIFKVEKLNLETINGGIDPFNVIIVRAANPNKKLGW